jgi:hypothetical protein
MGSPEVPPIHYSEYWITFHHWGKKSQRLFIVFWCIGLICSWGTIWEIRNCRQDRDATSEVVGYRYVLHYVISSDLLLWVDGVCHGKEDRLIAKVAERAKKATQAIKYRTLEQIRSRPVGG